MIVVLATANHRYTHRGVERVLSFVRVRAYEAVFRARSLPGATYVFTDLDRLSAWQLELAADLYRLLGRAGCRVLNDPARVLQRYALLHRLHSLGINRFRAWRPDEGALPDRFPVFLRTQAAHRGMHSGLLEDAEQASAALNEALDSGYPLANLMFIEYCAEPTDTGLFWKHAVYKIGDKLVPGPSVLDRSWIAKYGETGLASDAQLRFEQEVVREGRFVDRLRPAFEAAMIDYGRADFAIVEGGLAVYEINTNPLIGVSTAHRSPIRVETLALLRDSYLEALAQLDQERAGSRRIVLRSERFQPGIRRRLRYRPRTP